MNSLIAQNIFFAILAVTMIVSALKVVTSRNVVHAALFLVVVLAGVAGMFILLLSEFVAVVQVLVYIGAVVVLFLFGIMLTRAKIGADTGLDTNKKGLAILTSVALFAVMGYSLYDAFEDFDVRERGHFGVSRTTDVSDAIFSTYIVPFEAVSVLLLAALIGAIVVARRE